MKKKIKSIVIHCSDSSYGSKEVIKRWHTIERGWRDIGYHFIVLNGISSYTSKYKETLDGLIVPCRDLDSDLYIEGLEQGAHALGYNQSSIGVCWIGGQDGENNISPRQYRSLLLLCATWRCKMPSIEIIGHNEAASGAHKACPVIDMEKVRHRVKFLENLHLPF